MSYIYRMSTKDDQAALIRLWSEHSGWGEITPDTWAQLFLGGPFGPAWVAVMQESESGEIVGQTAFLPRLVCVKGRRVSAARLYALILARSVRGHRFGALNPLAHPLVAMLRCATAALKAEGIGLIFTLPNPNLMQIFRALSFFESSFPLWSLPLPLGQPLPLPAGYTVGPLRAWDERVDRLWARASGLYDCLVVRDARVLAHKARDDDYTVTAVECGGELVGLAETVQAKVGFQVIFGVLTADAGAALEATLKAACNTAHAAAVNTPTDAPRQKRVPKVGVLATPLAQPVLQRLGFERDYYDFWLTLTVLDSGVDESDVAPEKWYVSAND
jgi:hypothetical protein